MFSQKSSTSGTTFLDKKIHQNPKYKHVKPIVYTGIRRNNDSSEMFRSNYNRPDEVFKRLKLSKFVQLIIQIAQSNSADEESLENYDDTGTPIIKTKDNPECEELAPYQCVLMGIGEWDRKNDKKKTEEHTASIVPNEKPKPISPYLLLDVRSEDEYSLCHIITAKHYPSYLLPRSIGYETQDLLKYKNVPKKLIIVYDEEEALASRVCSTLVQRGYDNVYLLCGGLRLAQEKFPQGLINGIFMPQGQMERKFRQSSNDILKTKFQDSFTESDIQILKLTLELSFAPTRGIKPSSSYAVRNKSAQGTSVDFRHRNMEQGQALQLSGRRACFSATKPQTSSVIKPWK